MSSATACQNIHGKAALSFFSTTVSVILLVSTAVLNGIILWIFYRNKKLLRRSIFYKMLLNITIADFLTAIIADLVSISFHTKEGLGKHISKEENMLVHYTLFSINGVSILTMSLLCVDRIVALLRPLKYRNGLKNWKCWVILSSTWILANVLVIPYFKIGYIKYLAIFSFATVTITAISLILAAIIYKRNFAPFKASAIPSNAKTKKDDQAYYYQNVERKASDNHLNSSNHTANTGTFVTTDINTDVKVENKDVIVRKTNNSEIKSKKMSLKSSKELKKVSSSEKRVNKSFITMLLVFLLTYLPSVVMTTYMNLCEDCNCMLIHALRDITFLSILSSALWRPLNFIIRLKTIRREVIKLLGIKKLSVFSESSRDFATEKPSSQVSSNL